MDMLSARHPEPMPPPALTPTLRAHLIQGLRACIRRDETSADNLRLAGQPHAAMLARIADTRATLAEMEAL